MPPSTDTATKNSETAAFYAALEPKDRIIHNLASKMLKTRYDPTRSNAYLAYLKEKEKGPMKKTP